MEIRVFRMRESAKLPERAHAADAGMDLFYCPEDGADFQIRPNQSKIAATGIKVEIPYGFMLEVKNKSSVAAKKQLLVGACVVDSGYNGEVFVNLHNVGAQIRTIKPGQKIAQAVMIPITACRIVEHPTDDLNQNSARGDGALGSTGE